MMNLGRICLNNILYHGGDLRYERQVFRAWQFKIDVGDKLHSTWVLNRFKQIFYQIVK